MDVYSNGTRIIGLESVNVCDLENPMTYYNEGIDAPVYIVSHLWEFTENQPHAFEDVRELIENQPTFTGDPWSMEPEHVRKYIDKHFYTIPFSKGEHGLAWYSVGSSCGWDCGTAGFFMLPRDSWTAAAANTYAVDLNSLMECMTAWVNGDEWATHEIQIEAGSINDEVCAGFYGREEAAADACIEGFDYLGDFDPEDECELFERLQKRYPERYVYVEHTEHVPEKIIPAHDVTWTEFTRIA